MPISKITSESKLLQYCSLELTLLPRLRQYRTRISQWGQDKNIKPQEMKAIVRKRLKRKLIESDKRDLQFEIRGNRVEMAKVDRYSLEVQHYYITTTARYTEYFRYSQSYTAPIYPIVVRLPYLGLVIDCKLPIELYSQPLLR